MTAKRDPEQILREVKALAREYYEATGKPLGATGEIAEYEAARILSLQLLTAREAGHDAKKGELKFQIKGRRMVGRKIKGKTGKFPSGPWDYALLVLLDEHYEAQEIYLAERATVMAALDAPGSRGRTEKRQLAISKFIALAGRAPIWSRHLPEALRAKSLPNFLK